MKLFEIRTEHSKKGDKEVISTLTYVTASDDKLKTVVDYFTEHCYQYDKDLMGVQEVLTITHHLQPADEEEAE